MATRSPAVSVELEAHQNVAPEGLRNSQALASLRSAHRRLDRTARNYAENLLDERQALLDLKKEEPDSRIDVALPTQRDFERQLVIGCIGKRPPSIERPAGCPADVPAGPELRGQFRFHNPRGDGPILQRCRIVVELNQVRKNAAHRGDQSRSLSKTLRRNIAAEPSGDNHIHHQTMAEARFCNTQCAFTQDGALRLHQRKRRIVADRADISKMIGQTFELGHQRPQIARARWRHDLHRGLRRLRKRECVSDSAVARGACRKLRNLLKRRPLHERLDALVYPAKALLQPYHVFPVCRKTEMSRLNDAGMHKSNRNLVQSLSCGREKIVRNWPARGGFFAEWVTNVPEAEIEPRPHLGRIPPFHAKQTAQHTF